MMLLEFSFKNFEEVEAAFDPKIVTKAVNATIPRTMRKARTNVSKEIRKTYNVKAKTIKDTVRLESRKTSEETVSILSYRGGALPVDRFGTRVRSVSSTRGRRVGVSAKVKKGGRRGIVSGGFPLRGRTGPTMQRTGDPREDPRFKGDETIERVFRLSVPQMLNDEVLSVVEGQIGADANKELNRNLEFFQKKAAR